MKKSFIIYALAFILLLGGAYYMYNKLAPAVDNNNLFVETESQGNIENDESTSEIQLPKALDFTVEDTEGNKVTLSDLEGKPVIINFWASWCGPCKNEMPDFEEKFKEYGDDIHFMMINVTDGNRETVDTAKSFIENSGYTFPVYYDTTLEASNVYGIYYLPTSLFINEDGYGVAQASSMIDAQLLQKGIDMIYNP